MSEDHIHGGQPCSHCQARIQKLAEISIALHELFDPAMVLTVIMRMPDDKGTGAVMTEEADINLAIKRLQQFIPASPVFIHDAHDKVH